MPSRLTEARLCAAGCGRASQGEMCQACRVEQRRAVAAKRWCACGAPMSRTARRVCRKCMIQPRPPCLRCGKPTPAAKDTRTYCDDCAALQRAELAEQWRIKQAQRTGAGSFSIRVGDQTWQCTCRCVLCLKPIIIGPRCWLCATGKPRLLLRPEEREPTPIVKKKAKRAVA